MSINDGVRKLPLVKWIVIIFSVFVCILVTLDALELLKLSQQGTDILQWLGSTIIVGYFGKSAYEHKVNKDKEQKP